LLEIHSRVEARSSKCQVVSSEMEGQRQIVKLCGKGVEIDIVRREITAMITKQVNATPPREDAEGEYLDTQTRRPGAPPACDQHLTATSIGQPCLQDLQLLAVVKDKEARERLAPGLVHQLELLCQREAIIARV
jgi:hypothetical protein